MPEKKTLLYVMCAVVLLILILFWFITTQMSGNSDVNPILFNLGEMIRCRFEMGLCISMYPNPVSKGKNVTVTFRTQTFYDGSTVCLIRNSNAVVFRCKIVNETCKQDIDNVQAGLYYGFIQIGDCENNPIPSPQQVKSKDVELKTLI
jgi:hypothetical protein